MELNKEILEKLQKFIELKQDISAKIVVVSKKTNTDNTYHLVCNNYQGNYFINIKYEVGYNSFIKCAYYLNDATHLLMKFENTTSPVIRGAYWFLDLLMLKEFDKMLEVAIFKHTNTCLICNRELTDDESIELGMGKTCRNKI